MRPIHRLPGVLNTISAVDPRKNEDGDYQIAAGLFDDQSMLRMSLQVFTDSRPEFYEFANKTKMMTGAEVIAMFAPPPK